MNGPAPPRIATLDLIRGVAVLGILAINITSFAAPGNAAHSPNLAGPGSTADNWAFAFNLVLFEGKMRALFSLLFGASLLLYVERKDAAGTDGAMLQLRRLVWLALIGWLHFLLLWDGDILFLYACIGLGALAIRRTAALELTAIALLLFTAWQGWHVVKWVPSVAIEQQVAAGRASPADRDFYYKIIAERRAEDARDRIATLSSWTGEIAARQAKHPAYPIALLVNVWGETLAFLMIGMALLKSGFFAGSWPRRQVVALALGGTGLGLALTLGFTAWALPRGYPELAMAMALGFGLSFPHLLMALGYAALLVLAAPGLLATTLGQRLAAAGQVAFTNYLGTTLVMCALFYGWGFGLFGQFGAAGQWPFVLGAWAVMLVWSPWWLRHFRQGPLEWLWRCLTAWRIEPLRR